MTAKTLAQHVAQVRYKPGWKFGFDGDRGMVCFYATFRAPNGFKPTWLSRWQETRRLTKAKVVRILWRLVLAAERHETGEFFRVGRQRPFDPHRR